MQIKSAYNKINNWIRSLSPIQYAVLVWLVAFILSVPVGLTFPENTLIDAAMTAAGGATGVTIVFYLMGMPDG